MQPGQSGCEFYAFQRVAYFYFTLAARKCFGLKTKDKNIKYSAKKCLQNIIAL